MTTVAVVEPQKPSEQPLVPVISIDELAVDYMAILRTQSKSRKTEAMGLEVIRQLDLIKGVKYQKDEYGNIYAVKGRAETYPAYVCHIDTVHEIRDSYQVYKSEGGCYYAMSEDKGELKQVGIGGDDKCGIIACIEMLHRLKNVKCAFFLDEEVGCLGSEKAQLVFFEDCRFAIQIDRQNGGDIITVGKMGDVQLCSDEFANILGDVGKAYGYKACQGRNTDVVKLKERGLDISCVNLSAGYYNPHKDNEYIVEWELLNCIAYAKAMASFTSVFKHKYVPKPVVSRPSSAYSGYPNHSYTHSKVAAAHQCAECDVALSYGQQDEGLCKGCIDKFRERAYLEVRGNETPSLVIETEELVQKDEIVLPARIEVNLPMNDCTFCGEDITKIPVAARRGYCEPCTWCSCGQPYKSYEEAVGGLCSNCLKSVDNGVRVCSSPACKLILETKEEILDGICAPCKKDMLLPVI